MPAARLPLGLKLAFAAPSFASAALVVPIVIHLPKFYADEALVPLGLLALAVAVGRAFDAVTDPLIGWLSDRTRSRWGRRRPYLFVGAPLCAVALWLLFTPPLGLEGSRAALWFCASYVLYHLFHTLYLIPHLALGAEITLDYHERSALFSLREVFVILGTFAAALAPPFLSGWLGGERAGLSGFSIAFGTLLLVLYLWLALRVRERPEFQRLPPNPFVAGIRRSLRNGPFRLLLVTSVLAAVPGTLAATLMRFYIEEVLRPAEPGRWLAMMLGGYFGAAALALPAWLYAARRLGKKPAWLASFVVCGSGILPLLWLGPGQGVWVWLCIACTGTGFGAVSALSLAIKADVIDYDQLLCGRRREAQFGAFWSFLPKFVTIPGAAIPIALLGSLGYAPNQPQGPEVVWAIRGMMALTPALLFGVALAFGLRLPLDEECHRHIRAGIAAHGRGEAAFDPIQGRWLPPPAHAGLPEATAWFLDHFSPGELRRWQRRGAARVLRDVSLWTGGCGVASVLAFAFVAAELRGLDADPGALAVTVGTSGGLALCGAIFHGLRIPAALRLGRRPPSAREVGLHLAGLEGRRAAPARAWADAL